MSYLNISKKYLNNESMDKLLVTACHIVMMGCLTLGMLAKVPTESPPHKIQERIFSSTRLGGTAHNIDQQSTIEHLPEYILWRAVAEGDRALVREILQNSVDIHWGLYGSVDSILQAAFIHGHDDILILLLEHSKNKDSGQVPFSSESIDILIGFARHASRHNALSILEDYKRYLQQRQPSLNP